MKPYRNIFIQLMIGFLLIIGLNELSAQVPNQPSNYITDFADLLSQEEEDILNRQLKTFEDSTTHQIFVLLTQSLEGNNIEELTLETATRWGVGQKGQDNGLLIAIYAQDRAMRFEVGYGLEAELTDYETQKIQQKYMITLLKNQDYFGAILVGISESITQIEHAEQAEKISPYFAFDNYKPNNQFWPILTHKEGFWYTHIIWLILLGLGGIFLSHYLIGRGIKALGDRMKNKWLRWALLWGSNFLYLIIPFLLLKGDRDIYLFPSGHITNIGYLLLFGGFTWLNALSSWLLIASKVHIDLSKQDKKRAKRIKRSKKTYSDYGIGWQVYYYIVNILRTPIIWLQFAMVNLFIIEGYENIPEWLGAFFGGLVLSMTLFAIYNSLLGNPNGGRRGSGFSSSGIGSSSFGGSFGGGSSFGGGFSGGGGGSFGGGGSSSSW